MKTYIPYIIIVILAFIICLKQCKPVVPPKPILIVKIDTFHIHDTIPGGKSVITKTIHDTTWIDSSKYHPAPDYAGLLKQYDDLGDRYFSSHIYKTPYKLGKYGTVSVIDTSLVEKLKPLELKVAPELTPDWLTIKLPEALIFPPMPAPPPTINAPDAVVRDWDVL